MVILRTISFLGARSPQEHFFATGDWKTQPAIEHAPRSVRNSDQLFKSMMDASIEEFIDCGFVNASLPNTNKAYAALLRR
jgi:hypothetical protein